MKSGRDILIVEDNPQNFELVEFLLVDAGYRVRWAMDAAAMRRELMAEMPALVLMDIQLPGVDGLALVNEIRQHHGAAALPVIALTAHAMRGDRERFLAAGCDGYISKPIETGSFIGQVEQYLTD